MDEMRSGKALVKFDEVAKLELRVGKVLECREHPNADKLLILKIDLGDQTRQICAGLKQHYRPEELVGKLVVVVANVEPRMMRGEASQGMVLAAKTGAALGGGGERMVVATVAGDVAPGSVIA